MCVFPLLPALLLAEGSLCGQHWCSSSEGEAGFLTQPPGVLHVGRVTAAFAAGLRHAVIQTVPSVAQKMYPIWLQMTLSNHLKKTRRATFCSSVESMWAAWQSQAFFPNHFSSLLKTLSSHFSSWCFCIPGGWPQRCQSILGLSVLFRVLAPTIVRLNKSVCG